MMAKRLLQLALGSGLVACTEGPDNGVDLTVPDRPSEELDHRLVVKFQSEVHPEVVEEGRLLMDSASATERLTRILEATGARFEPMLPGVDALFQDAHGITPEFEFSTVMMTDVMDVPDLLDLAGDVRKIPGVELLYLEPLDVPPPEDIAPPSTDFTNLQGYRNAGSNGVDAIYAASIGITGAGVRIADCEYGWNLAHEDLVDQNVQPEPGQTVPSWVVSNGWDSHGTAVLGELGAPANGYGVTGIAPGAALAVYPENSVEEGSRRAQSIANAIADSVAGDIVVLEMQTTGADGGYGPAEYDPVVWNAVQVGTSAGVHVIAAAGNGNQDLDSPGYASYRNRGDSGAIIVGAGSSGSRTKMSFSTHGDRVDVHGWGTSVTTTGYGSLAEFGGDKNQRYRSTFNGTSSATPIVAGAAALVIEYARTTYNVTLSPEELRAILTDTGQPQTDPANGEIGPLPDVRDAMTEVDARYGGCPWDPGHGNYCRDCGPCDAGEGDCEPGECAAGLTCMTDVGPDYGWASWVDVCEATCPWSPGHGNYCRDCGPCSAGEGDCEPGECAAGLTCVTDVGPDYGWASWVDVCEVGSASTKIEARVRGSNGSERLRLQIGGQTVATWNNIGTSWTIERYDHSGPVAWSDVRVRFDNDSSGRDAFVDWVELDDVRRQAEDQAVNTGTWQNGSCGGSYDDALHCNGYIAF
ncbi:MAG: S8 family serine peptidase [Myxococcota bacterium]